MGLNNNKIAWNLTIMKPLALIFNSVKAAAWFIFRKNGPIDARRLPSLLQPTPVALWGYS